MLIGVDYWQGLLDWLRDTVLADGKISQPDLDMLTLTDDVDEAVALMVAAAGTVTPAMMWFFAILVVLAHGRRRRGRRRAAARRWPRRTTTARTPLVPADGPLTRRRPAPGAVLAGACAATGCRRSTRCSTGSPREREAAGEHDGGPGEAVAGRRAAPP